MLSALAAAMPDGVLPFVVDGSTDVRGVCPLVPAQADAVTEANRTAAIRRILSDIIP